MSSFQIYRVGSSYPNRKWHVKCFVRTENKIHLNVVIQLLIVLVVRIRVTMLAYVPRDIMAKDFMGNVHVSICIQAFCGQTLTIFDLIRISRIERRVRWALNVISGGLVRTCGTLYGIAGPCAFFQLLTGLTQLLCSRYLMQSRGTMRGQLTLNTGGVGGAGANPQT